MAGRTPKLPPPRQPLPEEVAALPSYLRERLRLALIELTGQGVPVTGPALRKAAQCQADAAAIAVRAWKAGRMPPLHQPWDDAPPAAAPAPAGAGADVAALAARIRDATTDGERERISTEVAALALQALVPPGVAREVRGLLAEARQQAGSRREHEPAPEDPRRLLLVSPEAAEAARVLDLLVSDERRTRLLALLAEELEADVREHPNPDMAPDPDVAPE